MNETVRKALTSTIGRWIAGGFSLLLAPVLPALINFVNSTLGYNLSDGQVQSYSKTAALAIAGVVVTWLLNLGAHERTALRAAVDPTNAVNPDLPDEEVTQGTFETEDEDPDGTEFVPADHSEAPLLDDDPDREGPADLAALHGFTGDENDPTIQIEQVDPEPDIDPPIKGDPLGVEEQTNGDPIDGEE